MRYEDMPGIRRSDLWKISKTPLHFRYEMDHPTEPTPAMVFGIAAHKMILEPDTFYQDFAITPVVDKRTKEGKAIWSDFCDYCNDNALDPITPEDYDRLQEMLFAVRENDTAKQLLIGPHERAFTWTDQMTGEKCKVKVDCLTEYNGRKYIVDYKTTDSCEDGKFERACRKYGYKFQAGMYREGVFQTYLEQYGFAFIAQEKTAPYAVRVYFCDDEFVNEGYDQFRTLLGIYHNCKETGNWYGYGDSELLAEG